MIKLMSEREADECAKYGEVQTWSDDDKAEEVPITYLAESLKKTPQTSVQDTAPENDVLECPEDFVGSKIAREFGKSDGDREDMDRDQLQYAMDFYIKQRDDKRKMRYVQSESDEDES